MRDTADMMEDAFSEDTMMECSADDAGLDDLVDFTDDISNSAPTIRDAAERLLTLLGVENDEDDDFSSEDEGVELDEDSDENYEDDEKNVEPQNARLFHQLALSLAQELKYSQKQVNKTRLSTSQRSIRNNNETARGYCNDQIQCMEVTHDNFHQDDVKTSKYRSTEVQKFDQKLSYKISGSREIIEPSNFDSNVFVSSVNYETETRTRLFDVWDDEKNTSPINSSTKDSWAIGWDACATEAIRYLIEDEGLSPKHPTVLAMKNHLEIQRERTLAQYAV